jgi:hypothetical protein
MRPIPMLIAAGLLCLNAASQTPISTVVTDYLPSSTGLTYTIGSNTYNFGNLSGTTTNNIQTLTGFTLPSGTYNYNVFIGGTVSIRRVNNSTTTGNRCLVWMESSENGSTYNIFPPYNDLMESFFDGRNINKGTDNLFGNQGDGSGNNNNIERVDWISANGMISNNPAESGFAIFERGADGAHDPFCIAAILAVDASGNPSQYGPLVRVASANFGDLPNSALNYTILRKEAADPRLARSNTGNQKRGGVFISFTNLGVASGQTMFGYSLFAYDMPAGASSAALIDFTNTTYFPTNTSSNTSQGGIDLIAITGLFNTNNTEVVLPVRYKNWNVRQQSGKAYLQWQLPSGEECSRVEIEKSYDGLNWSTISVQDPLVMQFADDRLKDGNIYYRLKLFDMGKSFTYTTVRKIVYRSPAFSDFNITGKDDQLFVEYKADVNTEISIKVFNEGGQLLSSGKHRSGSGLNRVKLETPFINRKIIVSLSAKGSTLSKQFLF